MQDIVAARTLLLDAAAEAGIAPETLERIFSGAPADFPVHFAPTLPLFAHRLGMAGITLFGRVYLLDRVRRYPPAELIVLLRHEAEHVRQQRERGIVFYPKYLWEWGIEFLRGNGPPPQMAGRRRAGRWRRAYLSIPDEREAYAAGSRARDLINRK